MASKITILDGGMGRELKRMGAPFQQPEWSALALLQGPQFVRQAHDAFVQGGAQLITTNSYAVVPFHIGQERFDAQGVALARLAGELARASADAAPHKVTVAGSLPPALGSYRPDLFEHAASVRIHQALIEGLDATVDVWLAETQSIVGPEDVSAWPETWRRTKVEPDRAAALKAAKAGQELPEGFALESKRGVRWR